MTLRDYIQTKGTQRSIPKAGGRSSEAKEYYTRYTITLLRTPAVNEGKTWHITSKVETLSTRKPTDKTETVKEISEMLVLGCTQRTRREISKVFTLSE